jgi:hypothetical protein
MLKHYGNAILYRIVAATAGAMQPCMLGLVGTSNHLLMADRANQDFEQSLRKNRRHFMSLARISHEVCAADRHWSGKE